MSPKISRLKKTLLVAAAAATLGACGGGGGGGGESGSGGSGSSSSLLPGFLEIPNIFLLFPNPQKQADDTIQTNTPAYATAYYQAIDPLNERTTKAAFMARNGFGNPGTGTEVTVVFGDTLDLGYGRRMTARHNADGTMAFVVDNYLVDTGGSYGYSRLNVDAAVVQSNQRFIGTNAIEFSPGPGGGPNFVKFYNFAPDGSRNLAADLDGKGAKAMPGICTNCHGGRADALTDTGAFPTVGNSVSQAAGDVQGRLQALKVDTFDYSTQSATFTRANQEANLKTVNGWVLESYPLAAASAFPEDAARPAAGANEWQGTAAAFIKDAYGGDGMPNASYTAPGVPSAWVTAGQSSLYQNVVIPGCATCHILRGTANNSDLDFQTYAKFLGYSDRIKAHVIDRGNMPLAKIVYNDFWQTGSNAPATLASFLEDAAQPPPGPYTVRSAGVVLQPGRPIADPGPNRAVRQGATTLSAGMSLYATSFAWTLVSQDGGAVTNATLTNATTSAPVFNATADATYVVRLVATNATGTASAPADLTLVVDNTLAPAPAAITFTDIKAAFVSAGCTAACHVAPLTAAGKPPLSYVAADYAGGDTAFYAAVRSRINFTDIVASPLLRKPAGFHHGGGALGGFTSTAAPGAPARATYDLFLNWILNGAPRT